MDKKIIETNLFLEITRSLYYDGQVLSSIENTTAKIEHLHYWEIVEGLL